jgi:hypothetical protein
MNEWSVPFRFVVAALATWRVAHLVAREDGPFDVVLSLRARAADGVLGRLMDCPYCLSIWIAMPCALAVGNTAAGWALAWLGISGGASLLERLTERQAPHQGE